MVEAPADAAGGVAFSMVGGDARKVGSLSLLQMNNNQWDAALRVGLPFIAFFAWKSYPAIAKTAAAAAGVLWGNRLLGLNL